MIIEKVTWLDRIKNFFDRLFLCDHWWSNMTRDFKSLYFHVPGKPNEYCEYEVHQCKMCGKMKIVKLNSQS